MQLANQTDSLVFIQNKGFSSYAGDCFREQRQISSMSRVRGAAGKARGANRPISCLDDLVVHSAENRPSHEAYYKSVKESY